eukprot:356723-Chlamydomonas_euryale.AAC.2
MVWKEGAPSRVSLSSEGTPPIRKFTCDCVCVWQHARRQDGERAARDAHTRQRMRRQAQHACCRQCTAASGSSLSKADACPITNIHPLSLHGYTHMHTCTYCMHDGACMHEGMDARA